MAPNRYKSRVAVSSWKRPHTSIYGDNYAFGFNFYGDMMHWLDKRSAGVVEPVPRLPTVPETAFRKFARREKRSSAFEQETSEAINRTKTRIDQLVRREEAFSGRSAYNLRRVKSFGAFTTKALKEIEAEIAAETGATQNDLLRRSPLEYDQDRNFQELQDRRLRLEAADEEINEKLVAAGLRFQDSDSFTISELREQQKRLQEKRDEVLQITSEKISNIPAEAKALAESRCLQEIYSPMPPAVSSPSGSCSSVWELKWYLTRIELGMHNLGVVTGGSKLIRPPALAGLTINATLGGALRYGEKKQLTYCRGQPLYYTTYIRPKVIKPYIPLRRRIIRIF